MRQVFLHKGAVVVKEMCQPMMDEHSILVCVHYSFISSGTETATIAQAEHNPFVHISHKMKKVLESIASHGVEATSALIKSKMQGELKALGYACSGRVIAVGAKVKNMRVGDYVACAGAGFAHHAEFVCVPEHLAVRVSSQILKQASITTIGAIALQGIRQAHLQLGETVCVIGLGLLGQLTVQLAKRSGCQVIGIDMLKDRLELARTLGADYVLHATDDTVRVDCDYITNHYGVDATIITAAATNDTIMQQSMELTRKKGKVVIVGDVALQFDRSPFYAKEIDVRIACSYGPGRYDPLYEQQSIDYPFAYVRWTQNRNMQAFVTLLEQQQIAIDSLITHQATLDTIAQAYELLKSKTALGVLVTYDYHQQHKEQPVGISKGQQFVPTRISDTIRVGMIGAGGFAKVKLLPIISKIAQTKINAVADADIAAAVNTSGLYKAAKACTDYTDFFKEDLVDAVVIASPHKFHCAQTIDALLHGKAAFIEKPMVTTRAQLEQMRAFLQKYPDVRMSVDYNRSFAPFAQKIKQVLHKRKRPLIMHYRMNAGFIDKNHWIQTEVGAGRIIGEACHIVDLFCFLVDCKPVAVSVESMHSADENIFPTDNFCMQISFEDGSVCSLLYTSVGNTKLSKERMELFFDGKSIIMDDYMSLQGYGLYPGFDEYSKVQDKGHDALVHAFFSSIGKQRFEPPIDYKRLDLVADLTLTIDELACKGGGAQHV